MPLIIQAANAFLPGLGPLLVWAAEFAFQFWWTSLGGQDMVVGL